MQALVISDIHGEKSNLKKILQREDEYDLVLVLGDITDITVEDYAGTAEDIMKMLDRRGKFVKAVPGNMDNEEILRILIERRVNLHKEIFSMEKYDFIGFGGGTTPVDTPFEPDDEERGSVLSQLLDRTKSEKRVIVSHHPPRNTLIDRTPAGDQVGSESLRRIIEKKEVDLVLSGHIHEAFGEDRLGDTVMVNPGPVKEGRYALIEMGDDIEVELKSL